MEFASTRGISSLFHYCPFVPDRLDDLIGKNRVYLSDTSNFNDPWDCRPCFDATQLDNPTFYERQVRWFYEAARRQTPSIPEAVHQARANDLRKNRALLEAAIAQMSTMDEYIVRQYRIFCLTTQPSNILMWSHYARNHTGVCIEFSCANAVFSGAFKVQYAKRYPLFDVADQSDDGVLVPLVTKSDEWAYEDEYRLIAQERSAAVSRTLLTDGNYLALPAGCVRSVIVGCVSPPSVGGDVATILRRYSSSAKVRKIERVKNLYQLKLLP